MQQIGFSLMAAMCTQGNSAWLTTKISCIFRTEQLQIFSATGPNTVFLCYPVCKLNGWGEKILRWVCGGGLFGHRQRFAALELCLGKITSYKLHFTQFMR